MLWAEGGVRESGVGLRNVADERYQGSAVTGSRNDQVR